MNQFVKLAISALPLRQANIEIPSHLPPIYASFLRNFDVGRDTRLRGVQALHSEYSELVPIARLTYLPDPDNVLFGCLLTPDEAIHAQNRLGVTSDIDWSQFQIIGEDGTGHNYFLVGLSESNRDQVFIECMDKTFPGGQYITYIARDIYTFMLQFSFVEKEGGVGYGIGGYDQLVQMWGEDYWRDTPPSTA